MTIEARTRYGKMQLLDNDYVVSNSLKLYGEWAQKEICFLSKLIQPGATILDIGAFIGTHTLAFSSMAGPRGHVISFEPRAETFELLKKNIELNERNNVSLHQNGLGSEQSTISLKKFTAENPANFASLELKNEKSLDPTLQYTVEVLTLDSYQLEEVHLIKIDVEGMERDVLDGASLTIKKNRPAIFAECNSIAAGLKLLEWSKSHSYECLGHLSDAFNANNFNNENNNVFGASKEFNLLLIPIEKLQDFGLQETSPIDDADDIAALILHKPQYPHEVLINANRSRGLGISYPSPAEELKARQLAEALKRIQSLELDLHNFAKQLQEKASHTDFLQMNVFRLIQRTAELLEQKTTATIELNQRLRETDELQNEKARLLEALHSATAEIAAIKLSRSWKFSAPLRYGGRALRILRSKIAG